jgi:transcriptional regulator with XRE-family HTH domain
MLNAISTASFRRSNATPPAYDLARRIWMVIGEKLKALREQKKMSQGDIEKRTGLLRCYIFRVENGHTVPAIETLEKMARQWKFRCTNFSTTAKSLRPRIFRRLMTTVGAVLAAIPGRLAGFAGCYGEQARPTRSCSSSWPRRCHKRESAWRKENHAAKFSTVRSARLNGP